MAGDWIPYEIGLHNKPKIIILAEMAKIKPREVVGTLLEFWGWASMQTADGFLPGITIAKLPMFLPGTRSAFWQAMASAEVAWIEERPDGLMIPRADKWITRGAKARLKANGRQAEMRKKQNDVTRDCNGNGNVTYLSRSQRDKNATDVTDLSRCNRDKNETTEQNRTEENRTEEKEDSKAYSARAREGDPINMGAQSFTPCVGDYPAVAAVMVLPEFQQFHTRYIGGRRCAPRVAAALFAALNPPPVWTEVLDGLEFHLASSSWQQDDGRFAPRMEKFIEARMWVGCKKREVKDGVTAW